MIGPTIEPSEVGTTGLLWLFLSYGYVLYHASNLISEGSELLLLVPSLAGLVGGVVLPLLGSVPDGAIILFSGLGAKETAQETLSVGVGALAGSTIMLLTVPFALSIYGGRVDLDRYGMPDYFGKPKLTPKDNLHDTLTQAGVTVTDAVSHSGVVMVLTTIPYFLIQIPALFMHGPTQEVADGEHWWSLGGLLVCLAGLIFYLRLQLNISKAGEDQGKRIATVKKLLKKGQVSLSGAVAAKLREDEAHLAKDAATEYQSLQNRDSRFPPPAIAKYLKEILSDAFHLYDNNGNGELDVHECYVFFRDFNEQIHEEEMKTLFAKYDTDNSGHISLDEFIGLAYALIKAQDAGNTDGDSIGSARQSAVTRATLARNALGDGDDEKGEEEEVPAEFFDLSPDEQQAAIKKKAFIMLGLGTFLVMLFSDPMVDVMQEIANRIHMSAFYVSFCLAPLASNASELLSSMYYASKKTRKTITVSLSTLCGAASLNNTFCLSIFFFLIYFRGLAWQYTAETLSIVVVEIILGLFVQKKKLTLIEGAFILSIFPLSLVLVATMEHFGFD